MFNAIEKVFRGRLQYFGYGLCWENYACS